MSEPSVRFVEIPCRMSVVLMDGEPASFSVVLAAPNGRAVMLGAASMAVLSEFVRATVAHHASSEAAPATDALPSTSSDLKDAPESPAIVHRNAGAASERGEGD